MSVIFDKIKEVKESFSQKELEEESLKREMHKLNDRMRQIEHEKLILKGSYDSLVDVGVKTGEITVDEEGRITLLDDGSDN